tara:strand:+ start:249 stop:1166 length:918 start_codon:yes stop_codon:yes gene_type:complete
MPDPWTPLIKQSSKIPKNQLAKSTTTFYHWALANGYYTPHIEREKRWTMCGYPAFRRTLEAVRWCVWKERTLCHGVHHDGFLVAPNKWPPKSKAAWGLKEPPTPYEAACAMLIEPQPGFWQLAKGAPGGGLLQSVTYWWLSGLHPDAINNLLGRRRSLVSGDYDVLMSKFIRHAMTKGRFAVWALGTNLTPACTSRHVARAALTLLEGKRMQRTGGINGGSSSEDKAALKKLIGHPFITSQLKSGRRLAPIDRPLYKEGVVWPSLSGKLEWLSKNEVGGKRVLGGREILFQYPEQHPPWLKMTRY